MRFRENKFFQKLPDKEKNFVEAMWKSGAGYPIPYDREYLSVVCFAEGLNVAKTLPKAWFFRTIYNLRVTGIIDLFFAPCGEARLYFVEKKEQMLSSKAGPFEEGATDMGTGKWNRCVQRDDERIGEAGQLFREFEKVDTRSNTKNVTIPPKKRSRHKWSGNCADDLS